MDSCTWYILRSFRWNVKIQIQLKCSNKGERIYGSQTHYCQGEREGITYSKHFQRWNCCWYNFCGYVNFWWTLNWQTVSFIDPGVKKTRYTNLVTITSSGTQPLRFRSEAPWWIEPQSFEFRAPMLYRWATETLRWARSITKFIWQESCILLRISNVDGVMFVNRIRQMVCFELGKELFSSSHVPDKTTNIFY